jgi:hypothetical protein
MVATDLTQCNGNSPSIGLPSHGMQIADDRVVIGEKDLFFIFSYFLWRHFAFVSVWH